MKRLLALILVMISFASCACAGDWIYIANPNPADRLHLRAEPYEGAKSLARYYNGAPIERTGFFNMNGWVEVQIGLGSGVRKGYVMKRFLSHEKQASAMPQYAAVAPVRAYQQPNESAKQLTIDGGSLVSLMGFADEWWHVMVHTLTSEGPYTCFVPAGYPDLISLDGGFPVNAYISNPDPTDRLHLRAAPDQKAKSLGKYYNGTVGTLMGFSEDGEWIHVNINGRKGYMMTKFVTIEGKTNHTRYGVPTCRVVRETTLYHDAGLTEPFRTLEKGYEIDVFGLIDEQTLCVRITSPYGSYYGYIRWQDTSYIDPK